MPATPALKNFTGRDPDGMFSLAFRADRTIRPSDFSQTFQANGFTAEMGRHSLLGEGQSHGQPVDIIPILFVQPLQIAFPGTDFF